MRKSSKQKINHPNDILGANGLLSKVIPGFNSREPQLVMADTITKALNVNAQLIIEAGTGTGKTFGYLVPIFISQKKTIISTGTKNLQDQLFFKDIPVIANLFSFPYKVVLLKGRANYLCHLHLKHILEDGRLHSQQLVTQLHTIKDWSHKTKTGDIAELKSIPEDSSLWPQVTSTVDNCLNQDCEFYKDCFVLKARQQAMAADLVVVNHHLYFSDIALQEKGFGELLPGAEVVIFDEAHHLPDIASQFFSTSLSSRQFIELARDSHTEAARDAKDMSILSEATDNLQVAVFDTRNAFGVELRRAPWPEVLAPKLQENLNHLKDKLLTLETILKEASVRSKGLESCWRRASELLQRLHHLTDRSPENTVHWFETYAQSFSIQLTPIIVADYVKQHLKTHKRTWIFTSATLTVKNNFQLFINTMGLDQALQLQLQSPFNYQKQALLYVPRGLPDTNAKNYNAAMINVIIPLLEITQGRTFILFTSYKALEYVAESLKSHIEFPLLLQGSMPKHELIDRFKEYQNAVLLGTSSFWHGVDVRGDALSCVIIDKLPFAAPDDPILQAKIQMLKKQGADPFLTYQLPNAVLTLKQGAGRLIRDVQDRGLLVICDPRMVGARYGQTFIQSLPTMPRTRDLTKVKDFFKYHEMSSH